MEKCNILVCLVLTLAIIICQVTSDPAAVKGFYEDDPNIIELKSRTFGQTINGAKEAHLVEFYMSWCGHCRAFAPIFRRFAREVSGWKGIAKIAAINCASEEGKATCQAQGIMGVPTLKYFKANTNENSGQDFAAYRSVTKLKSELLRRIVVDDSTTPNIDFRPIEEDDKRLLNPRTSLVALVVDETNSTIPFELMIEMHNHPQLTMYRALPTHSWLSKIEVNQIPSIVFFKNGEPVDQAGFKDVLRRAILEYVDGVVTTHAPGWTQTTPMSTAAPTPVTDPRRFFVSETDMLLAVKETLEDEVPFKSGVLTTVQIIALENYLETLKDYFPTQSLVTVTGRNRAVPKVKNLVNSRNAVKLFGYLLRWLKMERSLGKPVSTAKWTTILNTLKKSHGDPFPKGDWVHCKGSSDYFRGYTCGLWSTFHAMTVKAYIKNHNNPSWDPKGPMLAIRDYIKNFFGCTYCRDHFLKMSANMTEEIKTKPDSFMWMWRAHNQVNARLAGDPTEDPTWPKRQFPPSFLCPTCKTGKNGQWVEKEVTRYIMQYYSTIYPVGKNYAK